jgi:PAS domain S-box-containing protein
MGKPLRVLMVEDSEDDVLLMVRALKQGGYDPVYEQVEDAPSMRKALEKGSWDIILCDYSMPRFDGLAAIAMLNETGIDIPLLIVSGVIGEETAVACMRQGAQDYVMKGNLSRLVPAIERELKEAESRIERKQAEEALKESEELFSLFMRHSPVYTFIKEVTPTESRVLQASDNYEQMIGIQGTKMIGKTMVELFPPEFAAKIIDDDWAVVSGGNVLQQDEDFNGRHYATIKFPIIQRGKTLLAGYTIDITERKRMEAELKKSEANYRQLFDNSPVGIYQVSFRTGKFLKANDLICEYLGCSQEEITSLSPYDFITKESKKLFTERLDKMVMGEQVPEDPEYEIVDRNGEHKWLKLNVKNIYDSEGLAGADVVAHDITELKRTDEELRQTLESLGKAISTTIQVMVSAVESRDPYTSGHQLRSADIARAIASEMGLPQEKIEGIRMAGSIHDIGKLSIPAEILSKPTKLTNIEFSLIKEHSQKGYEMLKDVESPWPLAEIVYQHHERMDGSGYPRNLKGEEILIEAQILSVADVVEAMASHRPYRPAIGIKAALEEIEKNKGILYDDAVADACLRLFRDKGFQLEGTGV